MLSTHIVSCLEEICVVRTLTQKQREMIVELCESRVVFQTCISLEFDFGFKNRK